MQMIRHPDYAWRMLIALAVGDEDATEVAIVTS